MQIETERLTTADGVTIIADLAVPSKPRGAVAIAHPHPLYGGDRHSPVVASLFNAAFDSGWAAIRFDFRGSGESGGSHDAGRAERLDLAAALARIARVAVDGPLVAAGYSFGSMVALGLPDPDLAGWLAVAPPLGMSADRPACADDPRPTCILGAAHDQFTSPDETRQLTADWMNTTVQTIDLADHFLAGRLHLVGYLATRFLESLTGD